MEPIQRTLQKWMKENESFQQRHEQMKHDIINHPHIANFLMENPDITEQKIAKHLNKLYEYTTQSFQCEQCESPERCINMLKGHSPLLEYRNGEIHLTYEKCKNQLKLETQTEKEQLIKSLYMPTEILQARMADVFPRPERRKAMLAADAFLRAIDQSLPDQGLYLTGPFGVGKTYLLGAIANELKKKHIASLLIYMPEFVREIHASIQDNTVQEKVDVFKKIDVLMLDDIGAESMSAWFRDEVLGAILQYRMMERLPVFFTSNYTIEELEQVLATSSKSGIEEVKAGRIMERIKRVSKEVVVGGENLRHR